MVKSQEENQIPKPFFETSSQYDAVVCHSSGWRLEKSPSSPVKRLQGNFLHLIMNYSTSNNDKSKMLHGQIAKGDSDFLVVTPQSSWLDYLNDLDWRTKLQIQETTKWLLTLRIANEWHVNKVAIVCEHRDRSYHTFEFHSHAICLLHQQLALWTIHWPDSMVERFPLPFVARKELTCQHTLQSIAQTEYREVHGFKSFARDFIEKWATKVPPKGDQDDRWPDLSFIQDEAFQRFMQKSRNTPGDAKTVDARESQPSRTANLFEPALKYCTRCCLPETAEDLDFDSYGMCQACVASEVKMRINWTERRAELDEIMRERAVSHGYGALIPISGGKDSTFQLHVMSSLFPSVKMLGCTFSHGWWSDTGVRNLELCLTTFDLDHIMMIPKPTVRSKLARKSLAAIGDSCWHCHAGVGAFPPMAACAFDVPFLVFGESSGEPMDGRSNMNRPLQFTRKHFETVSGKISADSFTSEDLAARDLLPYTLISDSVFNQKSVQGIFLGDYIFWDEERQMEFMESQYGWGQDFVEGTYKRYKSVECLMSGVHDYAKFWKRGFGRTTDHASADVRAGLLSREQAISLIEEYDTTRPKALDYYLALTNLSEKEFQETLLSQRTGPAKKLPRDMPRQ